MKPTATIEACRASHRRLLAALERLTDDDFAAPSLLPRYTRGHVVTHLANKARAHVVVFGGPLAREVRRLHPDGYDPDAAADAGARRSAIDLRADLKHSLYELERAWESLDDPHWKDQGVMTAGPRTMAEIVAHQWRNVELHHVDLDIGYVPSNWRPDFVEEELAKRLPALPNRADHAQLLAWLLGRAPAPELAPW